ncbi:MAG: MATE family efflux transporter [Chloroflexi bacterium]|nr:MATE family efflux transporter [Chloroflexota bacterium]
MKKSLAKSEDTPAPDRPRRASLDRDWTKGSVTRNLWALSWPTLVSSTLMMLGPTIDMIWVGRLGAAAIGGVGVGGMAVMMVDTMRMGLLAGLRAMVARNVGAGDKQTANHAANQAFVLVSVFSILTAIVGISFAESLLKLLGLAPDIVAQGSIYLKIQFIGSIAMSFRMVVDAIMQASGDSMTPMKIAVFFRILHVILCPFLVFGWWVFPRLEVTGAAVTSVISQSFGMIIGLWLLFAGHSRLKPTLTGFRLDLRTIGTMVKIGVPSAVMGIQFNLGQFVLMALIAPFGTLAVAAHVIGQRVEGVVAMPAWGMGMAAGVLVGQNLGARQPERAQQSGWYGATIVQGFMLVCSAALLFFAERVVAVFNPDPALMDMGSAFLRIASVSYLVMGGSAIFSQCIAGAGETVWPMLIGIIAVWVIQLPLAYYLSHTGLGVYGIRWAIVAGMVVTAVIYVVYFQRGSWKTKRV